MKPPERPEENWSGRRDLNPRLRPWQGRTLPLSYSRSAKLIINEGCGWGNGRRQPGLQHVFILNAFNVALKRFSSTLLRALALPANP